LLGPWAPEPSSARRSFLEKSPSPPAGSPAGSGGRRQSHRGRSLPSRFRACAVSQRSKAQQKISPTHLRFKVYNSNGTSWIRMETVRRMFGPLANAWTDLLGYRRRPCMGLRVAIDRKVVSRAMREAISTGLYEATETRLLPCLIRLGNSGPRSLSWGRLCCRFRDAST
jgi:hypothetical protein